MDSVPTRLRALRGTRERRRRRLAPQLAGAIALALALAVFFSLLTPPGRAFTAWVGDRLGLGHPGAHPTLQSLRHLAVHRTGAEGRPAFVLLRGRGPHGDHYEFITYRMKREPGKAFPANGARCFELEFPEARNLMAAGCGLPPAKEGLLFGGIAGNSAPGSEYQYVSGRVSDDVAVVEVQVGGRRVPVSLRPIPPELIGRFHIRRPFKFFIAFFEDHDGKVTVTARDGSGRPVARRSSALTSLGLP